MLSTHDQGARTALEPGVKAGLKVLVVTPIYPSPDNPQAAIFLRQQVEWLQSLGARCRVLFYRPAPPPFPQWLRRRSWLRYYTRRLTWQEDVGGIPTRQIFYDRRWEPGEDVVPAAARALCRFVDADPLFGDADVIYANWLWTGGAVALRLGSHLARPVVAIARGGDMHVWYTAHPSCRPYVQQVLEQADTVLTNCRYLRDEADRILPGSSERVLVAYHGCDTQFFCPPRNLEDRARLRSRLGLPAEAPLFMYCGTIERRKGISEIASAWPGFSRRHRDWRLVVVGRTVEPPMQQELQHASEGNIIFAGQVSSEGVRDYLRCADAFLQPSHLEGLASTTMEAMAVGLPVITTSACGQAELVEGGVNGWSIPAGDATALEAAMTDLAGNITRAQAMGAAARESIVSQFDALTCTRQLLSLFASTAAASRRALPS